MAVELTDKQEQYAAWLALDRSDRPENARSVAAMALVLGVNQATLYRWQKMPEVIERTYDILNEAVASPDMVGKIVRRLYDIGMGDEKDRVQAIEKFLKYAGRLVDRSQVVTVSDDDLAEKSQEELLAEWDDEMAKRAERRLASLPES